VSEVNWQKAASPIAAVCLVTPRGSECTRPHSAGDRCAALAADECKQSFGSTILWVRHMSVLGSQTRNSHTSKIRFLLPVCSTNSTRRTDHISDMQKYLVKIDKEYISDVMVRQRKRPQTHKHTCPFSKVHLINGSLCPHKTAKNGISIGSAVFAQLTRVPNTQTHRLDTTGNLVT